MSKAKTKTKKTQKWNVLTHSGNRNFEWNVLNLHNETYFFWFYGDVFFHLQINAFCCTCECCFRRFILWAAFISGVSGGHNRSQFKWPVCSDNSLQLLGNGWFPPIREENLQTANSSLKSHITYPLLEPQTSFITWIEVKTLNTHLQAQARGHYVHQWTQRLCNQLYSTANDQSY